MTRVRSPNFPKYLKHQIYATSTWMALPFRWDLDYSQLRGLVALCLYMIHPSTYFHPNILLRWVSFMPQLEMLVVYFEFPVPNRDVERQLTYTINHDTHLTS